MLALPPPAEEPLFVEWVAHGSIGTERLIDQCLRCGDWWPHIQLGRLLEMGPGWTCAPCLDAWQAERRRQKEAHFQDLFGGPAQWPWSINYSYGQTINTNNIIFTISGNTTGRWST